jgi:hypothetical protein
MYANLHAVMQTATWRREGNRTTTTIGDRVAQSDEGTHTQTMIGHSEPNYVEEEGHPVHQPTIKHPEIGQQPQARDRTH